MIWNLDYSSNKSCRLLKINAALREGVDALKLLIAKGLTESARCFNTEQKYKHLRVQAMQTWEYTLEVIIKALNYTRKCIKRSLHQRKIQCVNRNGGEQAAYLWWMEDGDNEDQGLWIGSPVDEKAIQVKCHKFCYSCHQVEQILWNWPDVLWKWCYTERDHFSI